MTDSTARIYLDNAATSFPKPEGVYAEADRFQRELGTAVGRGTTRIAQEVQRTVDRCRLAISQLLGVVDSRQVFFTFNGTDSLNLALHGLLRNGDRVIASPWEHNSVLRPLKTLAHTHHVETEFLSADHCGGIDLDHYQSLLSKKPRLVCVTHASNVTGILQPVEQITQMAHAVGALVLLDAAQTAGHFPISMTELGVDLLASPGHKGLLGPLGTGLLAIRPGLELELLPLRQGGTGTSSEELHQPNSLPEMYEPGNHNAPGIFGLAAAIDWLTEPGILSIREHELQLTEQFLEGLRGIPQVELPMPAEGIPRVGVVSLNLNSLEPQVLSSLLDEHFHIETRAGLHCAPLAHQSLGTLKRGGTVRFSFGLFNTPDHVDAALEALAQIASAV